MGSSEHVVVLIQFLLNLVVTVLQSLQNSIRPSLGVNSIRF